MRYTEDRQARVQRERCAAIANGEWWYGGDEAVRYGTQPEIMCREDPFISLWSDDQATVELCDL